MNEAPTPTATLRPDVLGDLWELDLTQARERLIAARAHQTAKDSTSNRAHVAECRAQMDAILDMYLEFRGLHWSALASADQVPEAARRSAPS
jgi:hypothetical protein